MPARRENFFSFCQLGEGLDPGRSGMSARGGNDRGGGYGGDRGGYGGGGGYGGPPTHDRRGPSGPPDRGYGGPPPPSSYGRGGYDDECMFSPIVSKVIVSCFSLVNSTVVEPALRRRRHTHPHT